MLGVLIEMMNNEEKLYEHYCLFFSPAIEKRDKAGENKSCNDDDDDDLMGGSHS